MSHEQDGASVSARPARRPAPSAFSPHSWRSPIRGPWLTAFLGTLLVPAIAVIALTGFVDHWASDPQFAGNAHFGPTDALPVLFQFPTTWPSWSYAVTEGTHVTLGLMVLPLVLAKLWSVMPKLFERPVPSQPGPRSRAHSILMLVATVLLEFATGILQVDVSSLPGLNIYTVHYYGAWAFVTLFVLHTCAKLPAVRQAYRERGVLRPLLQDLAETEPESCDEGGLVPIDPAPPTISRRGLLAMVGGASLTIFAVQAGESIGGSFRRLALLAPRGRVFGTGPNDFPVNHTAEAAQISPAMTGPGWRLTVVGARTLSFSREQLLAMEQTTHNLTITCTDGWATTQRWSGLRLAELARLAAAPEGANLRVRSLEASAEASLTHSQFSDERALLAFRVNGVDISADHGYPARVMVPNVPGELTTKWVRELRFEAT